MAKRFIDTEKYRRPFMRGLQGAYKVLWDYLQCECDHAGFWYVDFETAQIGVGRDMPINEQDALAAFNADEDRIVILQKGKRWFIKPFIEDQYKVGMEDLNPENKAHLSVILALKKEGLCKGLVSPLQGAKDKEQEKEQDRDQDTEKEREWREREKTKPLGQSAMTTGGKTAVDLQVICGTPEETVPKTKDRRFEKPSADQVNAYALQIGFQLSGQHFVDYYESKGWLIGKNAMKDWKAAVRTWKNNGFAMGGGNVQRKVVGAAAPPPGKYDHLG